MIRVPPYQLFEKFLNLYFGHFFTKSLQNWTITQFSLKQLIFLHVNAQFALILNVLGLVESLADPARVFRGRRFNNYLSPAWIRSGKNGLIISRLNFRVLTHLMVRNLWKRLFGTYIVDHIPKIPRKLRGKSPAEIFGATSAKVLEHLRFICRTMVGKFSEN